MTVRPSSALWAWCAVRAWLRGAPCSVRTLLPEHCALSWPGRVATRNARPCGPSWTDSGMCFAAQPYGTPCGACLLVIMLEAGHAASIAVWLQAANMR